MSNILQKLFAAGHALSAGEELTNSATLKNVQTLTNVLATILASAVTFAPEGFNFSDGDVQSLATGLATLVFAINSYLTPATSAKVGFKKKDS